MTHTPARKSKKSTVKVVGKFASLKMERMISTESQNEDDFLHLAEFDSDVVSIYEQPFVVHYYDPSDQKMHQYTPDFLLTRRDGRKQVVEVKSEKAAQTEKYRRLFRLVAPILHREGYEFIVVTDKVIRIQPLLRNVKLLQQYAKIQVSNYHLICLNALFACRREIALGEIVSLLEPKGISRQEVLALLRHSILSTNLKREISDYSLVSYAIILTDERR